MKKGKLWFLFITGILLLCTVVGCGTEESEIQIDTQITEAEIVEVKEAVITEGNTALYKVIRPEDASSDVIDLAIERRRGLEEITGVNFQYGIRLEGNKIMILEKTPCH